MKNIILISSITDKKKSTHEWGPLSGFVDRFPQSITEIHMKSLSDVSEES